MSLNYRSLFPVPTEVDSLTLARRHFRSWLKSKRDDSRSKIGTCDWTGPGRHEIGDQAFVTEIERQEQDGSTSLRLSLDETNETGRWTTDVTAREKAKKEDWSRFVWIETSSATNNLDGANSDPKPPRIVRSILSEIDGTNGEAMLSHHPQIFRGEDLKDVEHLITVLANPSRLVPVVISSGVSGIPTQRWLDVISELTRDGVGLLSAIVLDESAAELLNQRVGPAHAVPFGGLRTFQPGAQFAQREDSARHRFITPQTMNRVVTISKDGQLRVQRSIRHAIAWNARRVLLDAGLPGPVRRVDQILRREQTALRIKSAPRSPITTRVGEIDDGDLTKGVHNDDRTQRQPGTAPGLDRLVSVVSSIFGTETLSEEHIVKFAQLVSALAHDVPVLEAENAAYEALLEEATVENDELREQASSLRGHLAEADLNAALAESEHRHSEREARWLRAKLIEAQQFEALATPDEPDAPSDLSDLLERLLDPMHPDRHPLMSHIVFTGNREPTEELLRYDDNGRIAGAAWEVILTLGDYAASKLEGENRSVHEYLKSPPPGRYTLSRHRFKPAESSSVSNRKDWRQQRMFRVPEALDATGSMFMDAHFVLGGGDTVSPRLHFKDAVDLDGQIYIGYIGRHLTNTMT